ncbi:hypothetical protein [Stenomitos frigidus]|nr:hypothetical protein [Stenomitos frigidus]
MSAQITVYSRPNVFSRPKLFVNATQAVTQSFSSERSSLIRLLIMG